MSIKIIVGANWGDEGKGRMVDYFAQDADFAVRYQGGNNAGHTVIKNMENLNFIDSFRCVNNKNSEHTRSGYGN